MKHDDIFPFIHKHNLFHSISDKIVALMTFNRDKALDLFLASIELITVSRVRHEIVSFSASSLQTMLAYFQPKRVVDQLEEHQELQFLVSIKH